MMRHFHERGTRWTTQIPLLVETPLFVDSKLTSMVQMADVCAYATRRFCEKVETDLFDRIFWRFQRADIRQAYQQYADRKLGALGLELPDERKNRRFL